MRARQLAAVGIGKRNRPDLHFTGVGGASGQNDASRHQQDNCLYPQIPHAIFFLSRVQGFAPTASKRR
jgi:hypothetical protein